MISRMLNLKNIQIAAQRLKYSPCDFRCRIGLAHRTIQNQDSFGRCFVQQ